MQNVEKLENKMREKGVTSEQLIKALKINRSTWYRKRKNPSGFSIGEAEIICKQLGLNEKEVNDIFFAS